MITYVWSEIWQKPMPKLIKVNIPTENKIYGSGEILNWLESNCQHHFYTIPAWRGNGVEFEDDEDAVMFALRWS